MSLPNPTEFHVCDELRRGVVADGLEGIEVARIPYESGPAWDLIQQMDPFSRLRIRFCPWCGIELEFRIPSGRFDPPNTLKQHETEIIIGMYRKYGTAKAARRLGISKRKIQYVMTRFGRPARARRERDAGQRLGG